MKKIEKKLSLSKMTIHNLEVGFMNQLNGGKGKPKTKWSENLWCTSGGCTNTC